VTPGGRGRGGRASWAQSMDGTVERSPGPRTRWGDVEGPEGWGGWGMGGGGRWREGYPHLGTTLAIHCMGRRNSHLVCSNSGGVCPCGHMLTGPPASDGVGIRLSPPPLLLVEGPLP